MSSEQDRLAYIETHSGKEELDRFVRATYPVYRCSLMQSRKRGHQKPHHASLPEYRRSFIESCVEFRKYMYPKPIIVGNNCGTCDYHNLYQEE